MSQTQHYKACPACRQPAPLSAAYCGQCGRCYQSSRPNPQQGLKFLQAFLYVAAVAILILLYPWTERLTEFLFR